MISREWTDAAVAAGMDEWRKGREPDPTLAPQGVPDLSNLTGYSMDDVRYNCVGLQSPAQRRQMTRTLLYRLFWIAVAGAFTAFILFHGGSLLTGLALVLLGVGAFKTLFDLQEAWAGRVLQVDGDVWTEYQPDSEGRGHYFVHIDDLRLDITAEAYAALASGGPYRIYYLQGMSRAIGGQVLPAWRPLPQPEPKKRSWWSRVSIEL